MPTTARSDAGALIPVVAAVVVRDRTVLLCQRPDGAHLPMLWEFPGGKIDGCETAPEALRRELAEELGVDARIGAQLHEVVHEYPEKRVWIRFYAAFIEGTPRAIVHRQVRWVPVPQLPDYPAPPPNAEVIARIVEGSLGFDDGGELAFH